MEQAAEYPSEAAAAGAAHPDDADSHHSDGSIASSSRSSSVCVTAPRAPTDAERAVLQHLYDHHEYTRRWRRRASIAPPEGPLDLPIALTVLYYAAQDIVAFTATPSDEKKPRAAQEAAPAPSASPATEEDAAAAPTIIPTAAATTPEATPEAASASPTAGARSLIHILDDLSRQRALTRRQAEIHHARKAEAARCETLYKRGLTRRERVAQKAQAHLARRAEEELAQCTFHPKVSAHTARLPSKGQASFMEKCIEWEEEAQRRTAAKYAQYAAEQDVVADRTSPHMSRGSRRLIEDAAKGKGVISGGPLDTRRPLWPVGATTAPSQAADVDAVADDTHIPVTSTLEKKSIAALKQLLQCDPDELDALDDGTDQSRGDQSKQETSGLTAPVDRSLLETSPADKKKTVTQYLARVEQDKERRTINAERLRKKYEPLLLEPTTGQPFFTPNALPTVERGDGKRVAFDELPAEEQATVMERLKKQHAAFALVKYFRQEQARRGTLVGPGEERKSSIVERSEAEVSRKQRNLERLQAEQDADCTFKPTITVASEKMARRKTNGQKIYERPQMVTQRERADREKQERPLYVPTSKTEMQKMMDRGDLWLAGRDHRLEAARREQMERETADCTFTPQRITAHGGNASALSRDGNTPASASASAQVSEQDESGLSHEHDGPLGSRRLGRTARRRSSVLSDAAFHGLAVSSDVRLMNEVEMLRSRSAANDPNFLEAVLRAYRVQGSGNADNGAAGSDGLDRSGLGGATVDLSGRSDIYVSPKRPENQAERYRHVSPAEMLAGASPKTLRLLLSNLTLRDAPRLPDEEGSSSRLSSHHRGRSTKTGWDDDGDDLYGAQLKSFSLSPVQESSGHAHRRAPPSLSPNRADMMAALERMETAQGTPDGRPTRRATSTGTDDDFFVQHASRPVAQITAASPWPSRHPVPEVVDDSLTRDAAAGAANAARDQRGGSSGEDDEGALASQLRDPWAALDAQTDAILRRRESTRQRFA